MAIEWKNGARCAVMLSFDLDGETLWIAREPYSTPTQLWQVHDRNGEPLAFVPLPAGIDVQVIEGDAVWAVVQDELGVPYVVRYRVQRQTR